MPTAGLVYPKIMLKVRNLNDCYFLSLSLLFRNILSRLCHRLTAIVVASIIINRSI